MQVKVVEIKMLPDHGYFSGCSNDGCSAVGCRLSGWLWQTSSCIATASMLRRFSYDVAATVFALDMLLEMDPDV